MVVLPVPGGPHRIIEGILPFSMAVRNTLPLPVRCSCPTKSSNVCGRIRSANGAEKFIVQIKEENAREEWNNLLASVHCYRHRLLCHTLVRSLVRFSIV